MAYWLTTRHSSVYPQQLDLLGGFNPTYRKGTQICWHKWCSYNKSSGRQSANTSTKIKAIIIYHCQSVSIIHEHSGKPHHKKLLGSKVSKVSKGISHHLVLPSRTSTRNSTLPNQSRSVRADFTSASIKFRASNLMSTKSSMVWDRKSSNSMGNLPWGIEIPQLEVLMGKSSISISINIYKW